MGNVHFSGHNRDIPSHVLTSRQSNPLETNNVRFRIKGQYLTDFSDKGIKDFIHKNFNKSTGFLGFMGVGWGGKDLEFKEVKAFIQAAAANAESLQGKTFDLTDPKLGLFNKDDITVEDIKHSFDLTYSSTQGRSDSSVSFVETQDVRYHHREARNAEQTAQTTFQRSERTAQQLQTNLDSAIRERDKIAKRIGSDAVARLAEVDGRISSIENQIQAIDAEMDQARRRLSQGQTPEAEKRELRLLLRGLQTEKVELQTERQDLQKSLNKKHGFWSFLGGGSKLEDLRKANQAVERAQARVDAHAGQHEAARNNWQQAVQRREAVERGESLDASPLAEAPTTGSAVAEASPSASGAAPSVAARDNRALAEDSLQRLLAMPEADRLEALGQLPAEIRQPLLSLLDEAIQAGQTGNPGGLETAQFETYAQLAPDLSRLRLNALLSWGNEAQSEYLMRVDQATRDQIHEHLNQQLFAQQLQAQVQNLRARLQSGEGGSDEVVAGGIVTQAQTAAMPAPAAQPAAETPVVPAPSVAPAPASPPAAPAPVLTAQSFAQLQPEERLSRFMALPAQQQDLLFSSLGFEDKQDLLLRMAQQANDAQDLGRLSALMPAAEKQLLANNLQAAQQETQNLPFAFNTAMSLILHTLSAQGVSPSSSSEVAPVAPSAPAMPQAPVVPAPPARPAVSIETEPQVPASAPSPVPADPSPIVPAARASVQIEAEPEPQGVSASVPVAPTVPAASNPEALAILEQLLQMDPNTGERYQAFYGLPDASKHAVMTELEVQKQLDPDNKAVAVQFQAEFLSGLAYLHTEDPIRQGLIAALPETAKADLRANLEATLPAIRDFEGLSAADKQELIAAQELLIRNLSTSPQTQEPAQVPAQAGAAGDDPVQLARELTHAPQAERQQRFAALPLEQKQQVFSAMDREVKAEMLNALVQSHPNAAHREALIASLSVQDKSRLATMFQESIHDLNTLGETEMVANLQQLLQELGAAVVLPAETAQAVAIEAPLSQPAETAAPLPTGPRPGQLEMSTQVDQLRSVVTQRSMFGFGGVTQSEAMHQLIDEIWTKGTLENKQAMARLLVENKEAQTLANVLANVTVDEAEAVAVISASNFPGARFMNEIDDARAFIMLNYLSTAVAQGGDKDPAAQKLIADTVKEYTGMLWDREAPFERMKNAARSSGAWDQLPTDLRAAIDKLLR